MKIPFTAAVIAMALGLCAPAMAATEGGCEVLRNAPGVLVSGKLSQAYVAAFTKSGRVVPPDGTINAATFMDACKADAFILDAAQPEPGAPFPGANSFTEAQAQGRIEVAGFTAVSGLKKDEKGIWRATAMQAGKSMKVALDYKGNLVAN